MKRFVVYVMLMIISGLSYSQVSFFDAIRVDTARDGHFLIRKGNLHIEGKVHHQKKAGNWISYFYSGQIAVLQAYEAGYKEGVFIRLSRQGYVEEQCFYHLDKLSGIRTIFRPGGHVVTVEHYKNGQLDGVKKEFYENGKIMSTKQYRQGLLNGKSQWYNRKGVLIALYHFEQGRMSGLRQTYYSNGQLRDEINFVANEEEGEYNAYYPNGKLKITGTYKKGLRQGKWFKYNISGKCIIQKYRKGKLLNEKKNRD